jgi:hypothetical protein
MDELDTRILIKAFSFLEDLCSRCGSALPRERLAVGFDFDGRRVPLIGPQGIFKPATLPGIPISITTVPVAEGDSYFSECVVKRGSIQDRWGPVKRPKRDEWEFWQGMLFQPLADQLSFFALRVKIRVDMKKDYENVCEAVERIGITSATQRMRSLIIGILLFGGRFLE